MSEKVDLLSLLVKLDVSGNPEMQALAKALIDVKTGAKAASEDISRLGTAEQKTAQQTRDYAKSYTELLREQSKKQKLADDLVRHVEKERQQTVRAEKAKADAVVRSTSVVERYAATTATTEGVMERYRQELSLVRREYLNSEAAVEQLAIAERGLAAKRDASLAQLGVYNKGIRDVGKSAQFSRPQLLNLGYQFNDIGVSLASGMNPLVVFVQQGAQIYGVMQEAQIGIKGLALALVDMGKKGALAAAAFAVTPIGAALITIGAAAGAAVYGISKWKESLNDPGDVDRFLKSLKGTEKQISEISKAVEDIKVIPPGFWESIVGNSDELEESAKKTAEYKRQVAAFNVYAKDYNDLINEQTPALEKLRMQHENNINTFNEYIRKGKQTKQSVEEQEALTGIMRENLSYERKLFEERLKTQKESFDFTQKELILSGQVQAAKQREREFYTSVRNEIQSQYRSEINIIYQRQIALEQSAREEGANIETIRKEQQKLTEDKVRSAEQAKKAYAEYYEYLKGQEKELRDAIVAYNKEIFNIEVSRQEFMTEMRRLNMTDDEKWTDKRREADRDYYYALKQAAAGNYDIAKEYAGKAINTERELANARTSYSNKATENAARSFDLLERISTQQKDKAIKDFQDIAAEAQEYKKEIDEISKDVEYFLSKEAIKYIEFSDNGTLDSIKRNIDALDGKTINVTVKEHLESVAKRRWGGLLHGLVPGYGGGDTFKAMYEGGEFVHMKEAVRYYGVPFMNAINKMRIPREALMSLGSRMPQINLPDISALKPAVASVGGGDVVRLEIDMGGASLRTTATKADFAEFETKARRQGLCLRKKTI
jgi:hypothetical protein